jgi:hypothetical protein
MLDQILPFLNHLLDVLSANSGTIGIVLGVLFAVAKAVSNEKAPAIVSKLQGFFDLLAKGCEVIGQGVLKLGQIAKLGADLLAGVVKSDGILGKK